MIGLRSITINLPDKINAEKIKDFLDEARLKFKKVRTSRLNLPLKNHSNIIKKAEKMSLLAEDYKLGIRWFNIAFDLTKQKDINQAYRLIKEVPRAFVNVIVTDDKIDYQAIRQASKLIKKVSKLDTNGYSNFRVSVSCNIKPNAPFFPATYSSGELGFSIALELVQIFISAIGNSKNLVQIRKKILNKVTPEIIKLNKTALSLAKKHKIKFHGFDLSLAPTIEKNGSIARLVEKLGLEKQGSNAAIFITAYLTDILKKIKEKVKTVGFNGVMYSLLEDEYMSKRNEDGLYTIDSLISYTAVCGCGLDMVPIPGDVSENEISSLILDIATLSIKLNKPLAVRLLPIPTKEADDFTTFSKDADFLTNTTIKSIKNVAFLNKKLRKIEFLCKLIERENEDG